MIDKKLVEKYLPKDLWDEVMKYSVWDEFIKKLPDLIEMILRSKSIDSHEEKQNWFNLLPLMNDEQIERLRNILLKEKRKLQEIEEKYKKTTKNKMSRDESKYQKKISSLRQKERELDVVEDKEADALLSQI